MSEKITISNIRSMNFQNGTLVVECDSLYDVSDGSHTVDDIYEHRLLIYLAFIKLANSSGLQFWKSKKHSDGSKWEGWFVCGTNNLNNKQISYHLPDRLWSLCKAVEVDQAPEYDGHTPTDVLYRLAKFIES